MSNIALVQEHNGQPMTTSLLVAEFFEKEHKNVLQSIQRLECSREFDELNFQRVEYRDSKGQMRPMVRMTRDGFSFLCMGFTGREAAKWKENFIDAFNKLEKLASKDPVEQMLANPDSAIKMLTAYKESEEKRLALVEEKKANAPKVGYAEVATCNMQKFPINKAKEELSRRLGRKVTNMELREAAMREGYLQSERPYANDRYLPTERATREGVAVRYNTRGTEGSGDRYYWTPKGIDLMESLLLKKEAA